jgi:hypothetical protein
MNTLSPRLAAERHLSLSRRAFLRGLGVTLALPSLESLAPGRLLAATAGAGAAGATATTATGAPLRMAFLTFANGCVPEKWFPTGEGRDFQLNDTMAPLAGLKDRLQVLGGLNNVPAAAGPDGPGDHGRGGGTLLTAVRVKKTAGGDYRAGVSADQIAAKAVGHLTPFASLQMSCDTVQNAGNCDSGYACVYQKSISWSGPTTPLSPETNPRLVFERLFGAGSTAAERRENLLLRQTQQRSVLDFVSAETRRLSRGLSTGDHRKLDEYLTSVREIEQRIQRAEAAGGARKDPGSNSPSGIPEHFPDYMRLNMDMLVLAFQTDSTRVATFMMAGDGNNRSFAHIGVPEGHHHCTHHGNRAELVNKTLLIEKWYVAQLAYFMEKMDAVKDPDGHSLLHNSMIMYGTGLSNGNRHLNTNLPVILAGSGGGTLAPGRYQKYNSEPIANLYLSMIDRMGVSGVERFGDSTGRLADV